MASYVVFRFANVERWEKDGEDDVVIPPDARALYSAFRPLTYADGALTGMRFHIGPHAAATNAAPAPG